jgi:hypothetical protein
MKLRRIGILITNRCNIECKHCYINCGPHRSGNLELDLAERLLREAKELGLSGPDIHLGGGEAFLYFDRVMEILEIAARLEMTPLAWVETNCFWCTSDDIARDRLTRLHKAGAGKIWMSTDPYHQEYVPFENVQRAYRIGVEIFGHDDVMLHNMEYFNNPEKWSDIPTYVEAFPPIVTGRAYTELSQYMPRRPLAEFADEKCAYEACPIEMEDIHINPDGSVMASNCSGLTIGNAESGSLSDIFHSDDWQRDEIVKTVTDNGPVGLLDLALDFEPKETYAQKCELCWEVRSHLAVRYPHAMSPVEIY